MAQEVKITEAFQTPPLKIKFEPHFTDVDQYGKLGVNLVVNLENTKDKKFLAFHKKLEDTALRDLEGTTNSIFKDDTGLNAETEKYEPNGNFLFGVSFGSAANPKAPKTYKIDENGNEVKCDLTEFEWGDTVVVSGQLVSYSDMPIKTSVKNEKGEVTTSVTLAKGFSKYGNKVVLIAKGENQGTGGNGLAWDDDDEEE